MNKTICDMVDFVNTGECSEFAKSVPTLDELALCLVLINLLGWLKSKVKFPKRASLALEPGVEWCEKLRLLVSTSDVVAYLFEVNDNHLI